jgi:pSer/pThr/pTyr-binding forkhead associated (FHA) protein
MAAGTKVQLRLGERVVAEVSFRNDELRIGRMKENDLIINNLAVSRFHAVLRRTSDGFEIEDLGSENGTLMNGAPVAGKMAMPAGAELLIGKHTLSIRMGEEAAPAPRAKSDAWDAAQTYFAPELAARAAGTPAPANEEAEVVAVATEVPDESGVEVSPSEPTAPARAQALELPDPDGLFAFGEDELQAPAPPPAGAPSFAAEFDVAAPDAPPAPARPDPASQTALFDFGATTDLGLSEPSLARRAAAAKAASAAAAAAAEPPAPPAGAADSGHAGLIVERRGKVERVAPFRGDEMVVGRGPSCDLVLAAAGVSRKHARLVREGESFRIFDLGSANGVRVNGERTAERLLRVGDVVGIDDFTLTFVIDREPLDGSVRSLPQPPPTAGSPNVTVFQDAPLATMVEQDVLLAGEDDDGPPLEGEKELEIVAELTHAPVAVVARAEVGAAAQAELGAAWVVEVAVASERLPDELRDALRRLDRDELRLPAELVFRRK